MKPLRILFGSLATLLLLQACSLTPTYTRPDAGLLGAAPASWSQSTVSIDATENAQWWSRFNSETLPQLQKYGLMRNHDFEAAGWQLAQAIAQTRVARASLFPRIDAEGMASRTGVHAGSNNAFTMEDTFSGGFQVSYELDLWGRLRSQADSAAFTAEATLNDWRAVGLSLESNIAVAFFQILALRERLTVQKDMLSTAEQTLEYITKQQRAGAASSLDLARQRSNVASVNARLQEIERQEQATKNALNNLLGASITPENLERLMASESITTLTLPAVSAGLPSSLLLRRPDILQAEAALKAANANIGTARAAFLPLVNLTVQGGWKSDELNTLFSPTSTLYSLASSLVTPIFQGGRLTAQHDTAKARWEELVARYQQAALSAFLETDTAIGASNFLAQEEENRSIAVHEAREAFGIVEVQYREGSADFLSLLDAQRTLLTAQDAQITVIQARLNASISLFKALGGGWGEKIPTPAN
jgi:efflux transporter, outer membrane factor (OMF) lipoprotein, NodT family